MALDQVRHPVQACYPGQNRRVFARLRRAALFRDGLNVAEHPVRGGAPNSFAWTHVIVSILVVNVAA
jgi:hypothetical protein